MPDVAQTLADSEDGACRWYQICKPSLWYGGIVDSPTEPRQSQSFASCGHPAPANAGVASAVTGAGRPAQETHWEPPIQLCVSLRTSLRPKNAVTATDREIQMPDFKKRPVILPILALLAFVLAGAFQPARRP